jgi:Mlc titration factor MtfA (ptsG expression regulator)
MGFIRSWRRKRTLARANMDPALWQRVAGALAFLRGLSDDEMALLRQLTILFLAEKEMHGAQEFELTVEVRLSIAVQACLPILNLGIDWYDGWIGVIVYPGEFRVRKEEMDEHGVVHSFDDGLSGEAWPGGPVVLSWQDVGMSGGGYNVVIHEFAHKLHMLRGSDDGDGFPLPHADMDRAKWRDTLEQAYARFCAQVDAGEPTIIDPYAADHPAEFFAVMSEAFFTYSGVIARDYAALYAQLAQFYRQDPADALVPQGAAARRP